MELAVIRLNTGVVFQGGRSYEPNKDYEISQDEAELLVNAGKAEFVGRPGPLPKPRGRPRKTPVE